nr:unnamed protein product [Callosobruchus analis]
MEMSLVLHLNNKLQAVFRVQRKRESPPTPEVSADTPTRRTVASTTSAWPDKRESTAAPSARSSRSVTQTVPETARIQRMCPDGKFWWEGEGNTGDHIATSSDSSLVGFGIISRSKLFAIGPLFLFIIQFIVMTLLLLKIQKKLSNESYR